MGPKVWLNKQPASEGIGTDMEQCGWQHGKKKSLEWAKSDSLLHTQLPKLQTALLTGLRQSCCFFFFFPNTGSVFFSVLVLLKPERESGTEVPNWMGPDVHHIRANQCDQIWGAGLPTGVMLVARRLHVGSSRRQTLGNPALKSENKL